jgi:hypothetical protein
MSSLPEPDAPIRCTPAFERAWAVMRTVLFSPFDIEKWISLGFCAWLSLLGQGGGFSGNPFGSFPQKNSQPQIRETIQSWVPKVENYVSTNVLWLVPLAAVLVVAAIAVWIVILWISSRGQFLFLDGIARNRSAVAAPWKEFAAQGDSLFLFRVVTVAVSVFLFLLTVGLGALVAYGYHEGTLPKVWTAAIAVVGVLLWLVLLFAAILGAIVLDDFIIPLMWLHRSGCVAAWKEFGTLLTARTGAFFRYLLMIFLTSIGIGVAVLTLTVMTCCILGCVMMIPFVGTVVLLPVLVFRRSLSLTFLAQFGPRYDVFATSR